VAQNNTFGQKCFVRSCAIITITFLNFFCDRSPFVVHKHTQWIRRWHEQFGQLSSVLILRI